MKKLMHKIIKTIKDKSGESLIETLASVVIVVLMMSMLTGSVVTAAKINAKAKAVKTNYSISEATKKSGVTFTLKWKSDDALSSDEYTGDGEDFFATSGSQSESQNVQIYLYETQEGYYFLDSEYVK